MRKQLVIFVIFATVILILSAICLGGRKKDDVVLLKETSYLSGFAVEDNIVQINCLISIENKSDTDKTIKLIGDFKDETDIGLISERMLYGIFADENVDEITIESHSVLKDIKVVFYAEYGGNSKMKDRNLPDIKIIEIGDE